MQDTNVRISRFLAYVKPRSSISSATFVVKVEILRRVPNCCTIYRPQSQEAPLVCEALGVNAACSKEKAVRLALR